MVAEKSVKINKRRLIRELLIIGGVAIVIFLIGFLPWLAQQPIPGYDPYAKYQTLFEDVQKYNYAEGRNEKLESRLDAATSKIGSGPINYYFNLKAKLYYYSKIGSYKYSNEIADEAMQYVPTNEEIKFVYGVNIDNYRALGDEEKVEEYENLYNSIEVFK